MLRLVFLAAVVFVSLVPLPARAASRLTRGVIANGGLTVATARSGFVLSGTAGQPGIGRAVAGISLGLGFWYAPPPDQTAVPGIEGDEPSDCLLIVGFPVPSPRASTISFAVPRRMHVTLRVYDIAGRLIRTLTDGDWEAGTHAIPFDAGDLADGIYICHMTAEGTSRTQRLVFVK